MAPSANPRLTYRINTRYLHGPEPLRSVQSEFQECPLRETDHPHGRCAEFGLVQPGREGRLDPLYVGYRRHRSEDEPDGRHDRPGADAAGADQLPEHTAGR